VLDAVTGGAIERTANKHLTFTTSPRDSRNLL
jgi:hypothetical protein